jgi:hypothetical protein
MKMTGLDFGKHQNSRLRLQIRHTKRKMSGLDLRKRRPAVNLNKQTNGLDTSPKYNNVELNKKNIDICIYIDIYIYKYVGYI